MTRPTLADPGLAPLLARGTVDRMSGRRTDDAWLDDAWAGRGLLLTLAPDGSAQVMGEQLLLEPTSGPRLRDAWFLGAEESAAYFVVVGNVAGGRTLRDVGARLADRDAGLLTTALGLLNWHASLACCPRDGTPLDTASAGWVRVCPLDGQHHFPRSDPAVIMLITSPDGDAAILGRQPGWPERMFSCLAGFVEPGESAEQAVIRECAEEAEIVVSEVRPVGSQPWPFPASLMLGFRGVADPAIAPVAADGELDEVAWFGRDDIRYGAVLVPPAASIANWLIAGWLAE